MGKVGVGLGWAASTPARPAPLPPSTRTPSVCAPLPSQGHSCGRSWEENSDARATGEELPPLPSAGDFWQPLCPAGTARVQVPGNGRVGGARVRLGPGRSRIAAGAESGSGPRAAVLSSPQDPR